VFSKSPTNMTTTRTTTRSGSRSKTKFCLIWTSPTIKKEKNQWAFTTHCHFQIWKSSLKPKLWWIASQQTKRRVPYLTLRDWIRIWIWAIKTLISTLIDPTLFKTSMLLINSTWEKVLRCWILIRRKTDPRINPLTQVREERVWASFLKFLSSTVLQRETTLKLGKNLVFKLMLHKIQKRPLVHNTRKILWIISRSRPPRSTSLKIISIQALSWAKKRSKARWDERAKLKT